jgi:hypothetical protein
MMVCFTERARSFPGVGPGLGSGMDEDFSTARNGYASIPEENRKKFAGRNETIAR